MIGILFFIAYINISLFLDLFSSLYDGVPCIQLVDGRFYEPRRCWMDVIEPINKKGLESLKKRPGGWRILSGVL
jgi:hypothetical protein